MQVLPEVISIGQPPPGLQQPPRGSGIVTGPAQIPGVAQRRLVLGAPGVARERCGVGERQAWAPQAADRVIVAGDRVERGERGRESPLPQGFSPRCAGAPRPETAGPSGTGAR